MSSASENTTVLLIGASRGLGYAIAAEYLERGAHVVATVRSTECARNKRSNRPPAPATTDPSQPRTLRGHGGHRRRLDRLSARPSKEAV
jgi:NAD(P)-dependent dehydrogenase (short-subunit alcohol dehydrogenase family)